MRTYEQLFDEGFKLGLKAWSAGQTLASCPFGPGYEIPEDACDKDDPRHMAWLYGWHEGWSEQHEDRAFETGFKAAIEGGSRPAPYPSGTREADWYGRGWIGALAQQQESFPEIH